MTSLPKSLLVLALLLAAAVVACTRAQGDDNRTGDGISAVPGVSDAPHNNTTGEPTQRR